MPSPDLIRGSHQIAVIARKQSDRSNLIQILIKRLNNEIASAFSKPRNDGILEFSVMRSPSQAGGGVTQGLGISDGILNEIASSFAPLTPRNDGILEFFFSSLPS